MDFKVDESKLTGRRIVFLGTEEITIELSKRFIEQLELSNFCYTEFDKADRKNTKVEVREFSDLFEDASEKSIVVVLNNHNSRNRILRNMGLLEDEDYLLVPALSMIRLYSTSICNASCAMCDIGKANNLGIDRIRKSSNYEIDIELIDKLLNEEYIKNNRLKFSIGMVEPLIHKKIGEIIKRINDAGHSVAVLTNGILLKKKAQEIVDGGADYIVISIDGPEEIHDSIRGRKGIYKSAIDGIKKIHEIDPSFRVVVNCAVSNLNFRYLVDMVESLEAEKIAVEVQFQHLYFISEKMAKKQNALEIKYIDQSVSVVSDDFLPEIDDEDVLVNQIKKLQNYKSDVLKSVRVRPDFEEIEDVQNYYNTNGSEVEKYNTCFFPYSQVSIKTDGDVVFHSRCYNYTLGNLKKNDIVDIFNNKESRYFRDKLKRNNYLFPACTRCCGVMGGW